MKLSTLPIFTATAGLTAALPQPQADPTYYYFRTSVQSDQPTAFNNYYLISWHTGAGLSDATFAQGAPLNGQVGSFNGTTLNWFYPDSSAGSGNYGVKYQVGSSQDAKWSSVCLMFSIYISSRSKPRVLTRR
jgi:hypothetical protein